jgi:hypothetical protein
MTSPRPYGGAYHSSPSFPDTPIYDSLVAERGTPQIAPIRVPSAYEPLGGYPPASSQPALPAALPALPSGPSAGAPHPQPGGYPGYQAAPARQQRPMPAPSPAPLPTAAMHAQAQGQAPTPQGPAYMPQQGGQRPYPGSPQAPQAPVPQQMRPQAPRPAAPRPAAPRPAPAGYQNPYPTQQQHPYPNQGYWAEQGPGR